MRKTIMNIRCIETKLKGFTKGKLYKVYGEKVKELADDMNYIYFFRTFEELNQKLKGFVEFEIEKEGQK